MLKKICLLLSLVIITLSPTHALNNNKCTVAINKDPKWSAYQVTISIFDMTTNKTIKSFVLKSASKNSPSVNTLEKSFDCQKFPVFSFRATFSPPIWENLTNQAYLAKKVWNLNSQLLNNNNKIIVVTVNFPSDFVDVPEIINLNSIGS